jgi:hypothetical protein
MSPWFFLIALCVIFLAGLFGSAMLGASLARRLFVRPDPKHPLNPHPYRNAFVLVAGAGLFLAIWFYGWMYWILG